MKKRIVSRVAAVALLCFVTASAAACSNETEEFVSKPVTGIDAMFDESLGYYNEHPCVVQVSETERYVYYTKNTARSENGSEYIAVRQGTFQDGTWTYGEPAAALSPAQSGWDSGRVFQADVIGGSFTYEGDSYAWLMAYAGTGTQSSRDGAQIGLAVASSPAGPWTRVGSAPFVTWSASDYTQYGELLTDGVNEPSLVSYNRAEQVILFYSLYNPNTVDSCKYVLLDLSGDLNALTSVKGERGNLLSSKGIRDMSTTPACIAADFALTADGETLLAVRDYYPLEATTPAGAAAVQVISAPAAILTESISASSPSWTIVNDRINALDTAVWTEEGKTGYDRIYSGCVIGDSYGRVADTQSFSVAFTSSATAVVTQSYAFTPMIHEMAIGGEADL